MSFVAVPQPFNNIKNTDCMRMINYESITYTNSQKHAGLVFREFTY